MNSRLFSLFVAASLLLALLPAGSAGASPPDRDDPIAFWTHERVAQAIPRDFVFDPGSGRFSVKKPDNPGSGGGNGKPGGSDGDSGTVDGASWSGNGVVTDTTGKVLFEMGGSYYVCSASLVTESSARSIVLTAAHCVYDETGGGFATNWVFIPNYDASPAPLDTNQSFCAGTVHGCWEAQALVVHDGYAGAGGFNTQATLHDFAFAVLDTGGKTGELAESLGTQDISFNAGTLNDDTHLFGYPAAKKYKGTDLVYCLGPLGFDPLNSNDTYRVGCKMTGGSSGGPWFADFAPDGRGTLMSVNSYGYSGINAMHGPVFGDKTKALFDVAETATGNTIFG